MKGLRMRRKYVCAPTEVMIDFTNTVAGCGINMDRNDTQSDSDVQSGKGLQGLKRVSLFIQEK